MPWGVAVAALGVAGTVYSSKKASDSASKSADSVTASSDYAANLSYDLGGQQLDFAKQQYNDMRPFADRIAQQQIDISDENLAQGRDYYDYLKSYRPLEQQMAADAGAGRADDIAEYDAANQEDARLLTMSPDELYGLRRNEIDPMVDRAVADSRGAYTRNINQAIRQGLRYGMGNPAIDGTAGALGMGQAQMEASAANSAREQGLGEVRNRIATGYDMRGRNMGALNSEQSLDWARRLDAAGLVKGMPGASSGAYGMAVNAGTSALNNKAQPGINYMQGLGQGANTMISGANARTGAMTALLGQPNYTAQAGAALGGAAVNAGMKYFINNNTQPTGGLN